MAIRSRKATKRQKKFLQNWDSLPSELLDSILESLPSIFDFIQFCLVCKHWRKVALNQKEQRLKSCHKQLPPLLLLNSSSENRNQTRSMYSVTKLKVVHSFNLPNHRDEDTWLCGSSHGWLAYADAKFMVTLVNPFTRGTNPFTSDTIRLPQIREVKKSRRGCDSKFQISKVVVSASPSLFPNDYEVLVIFENDDGVTKELAHFKSGDDAWTRTENRIIDGLDIIDATYYKGRFVAVTGFESDPNYDASKFHHPSIEVVSHPEDVSLHKTSFLVKSTSEELLLVNTSVYLCRSFEGTRIFKLGTSSCGDGPEWVEMESLGTDALFVDNMSSICVAASYSGCEPNSIYLKNGVVNLSSGKTRKTDGSTRSQPVTWIAPTMAFSI